MKKILFIIVFFLVRASSFATNYYLSNAGNDSNSGTSSSQPWLTLTQLNTVLMQPGDSVLFECGSIFRGEIIVNSSGTDSSMIYFGKYGAGNLPVISGAEAVTGWTNYAGNIYTAPLTQMPAHLFADDRQMTIARFPNSGFLIHQDGIGNSGFVDNQLTQPDGFWNGANVIMRTSDGVWEVRIVNSYSNDTIKFQSPTVYNIASDFGYYLDNSFLALDTAAEWYYDSLLNNIYFIAPGNVDPSSLNVEASVYNYGIFAQDGSSKIKVENIQFEKQKKTGIYFEGYSAGNIIQSCFFHLQGETGITNDGGSESSFFTGNDFREINGIGLSLSDAKNDLISHNQFNNIGLLPGYGLVSSLNNLAGMECNNSDSVTISQNAFDSIGSMAIFVGITNGIVSKNIIRHCLFQTNNNGSIFLYGPQESVSTFSNNIILSPIGNNITEPFFPLYTAGIYSYGASENIFESNTIAFASSGILISKGSSFNSLHRNLIYGCKDNQLTLEEGSFEGNTAGNEIFDNVFYSLNESSDVVKLSSTFDTFQPAALDSNYYFNPYAYPVFKTELGLNGTSFPTYYTLNQWQNRMGIDQNSHSTFFHRNRFAVTDTNGTNLISNSFFSNNFDGWLSNESDTFDLLLDNSTPLDFGCMKLVFVYSLPDTVYGAYTQGFKIDLGQLYQFHLSSYSIKDGNVVLKGKENDDFNGGYLAAPQAFPFDSSRHDYDGFIDPTLGCLSCLLSLELNGRDSVVWVDNVTLYNVNGILQEPEKKSRLFLNTSESDVTFDLGDSIFFNLDQVPVSGSFTLGPYSSAVLIFDSSMILSVHEQLSQQLIKVFPNPVSRGGAITLVIPQISDECEISICDLQGKKLFNKMVFAPQKNFQIKTPSFISPGTYFILARNKYGVWSGKIVVM